MEIEFKNVSFSYKKFNCVEKNILNNINIKFKKNKINAIIGPNGSGKTTLVKLIQGFLEPTNGKILVNGIKVDNNVDFLDYNFNVGIVMQQPSINFIGKTVREELEYYIKLYHYHVNEMEKRIIDSLKMVEMDTKYLDQNLLKLSDTEKRKVAIASLLIVNPKVIILDEPIIGLNYSEKKNLIKLIKMLKNRYKKTIIIASNNIDFIYEISDYVVLLNNKEVVSTGSKFEIFKNVELLKKCNIRTPKLIEFSNKVLSKKNKKLGYRDDINDLIKDIYRNVK